VTDSGFRALPFVEDGSGSTLCKASAHGDDDSRIWKMSLYFSDLQTMPVMKWIVFRNDSDGFHGALLVPFVLLLIYHEN